MTSGATEAIFSAIQGVCDAGDEVVLFEPYYDSYKASVAMAGAVPRVVTLHAPDWTFDPRELEAAFTDRTRVLLLNTPHNPTGQGLLPRRARDARRALPAHDALCITDEVYEHLVYEGRHVPMATLPGHAGAHDHDLVLREDVLADGLEDRLGGRAAGADGRRARGPPVRHVRDRHAAAARRGLGARGRARSTTPLSSPNTAPGATISRASSSRLGFVAPPAAGHVLRLRRLPPLRLRRRPRVRAAT